MSRAELRRQKRENVKKAKTFIMTAEELEKIRLQECNRAKKLLLDKNDDLAEKYKEDAKKADKVYKAYVTSGL